MLIRDATAEDNQDGRGGCQLHSQYSNGLYYVTIEHNAVIVRGWDRTVVRAKDGPVDLAGPHVSADFINPNQVAVTVVGFDPGTRNSRMKTFVFPLAE